MAVQSLIIHPSDTPISSSNITVVGNQIKLSSGTVSGEAVYQFDLAAAPARFVDVILNAVKHEYHGQINAFPAANEITYQHYDDVIVQVATSNDGNTWTDFVPNNMCSCTPLILGKNGVPGACSIKGPAWLGVYSDYTTGPDPAVFARGNGPGNALVINRNFNGVDDDIYFVDNAMIGFADERITWGLYHNLVNTGANSDFHRLEVWGGDHWDGGYGNQQILDAAEYYATNYHQDVKRNEWNFLLHSAVLPSNSKYLHPLIHRSIPGTKGGGFGAPFFMLGHNPVKPFSDTAGAFKENFANLNAWTIDLSHGGVGATATLDSTKITQGCPNSLKMYIPRPLTVGTNYITATTTNYFTINPNRFTAIQYDGETLPSQYYTEHGTLKIHHFYSLELKLDIYNSSNAKIDCIIFRSERSSYGSGNRTNFFGKMVGPDAAKAKLRILGEFHIDTLTNPPATVTSNTHWIDAVRVDQYEPPIWAAWQKLGNALPRLDYPGADIALRAVRPDLHIRVKLLLRRQDTTHGDPAVNGVELLYSTAS